uniref:Ig-like domain-containing protein n=1 Tax=Arcella intermedia TaxID=1963864 RepID=A0A6B2LPL2_9EUKA
MPVKHLLLLLISRFFSSTKDWGIPPWSWASRRRPQSSCIRFADFLPKKPVKVTWIRFGSGFCPSKWAAMKFTRNSSSTLSINSGTRLANHFLITSNLTLVISTFKSNSGGNFLFFNSFNSLSLNLVS